MHGHLLHVRRLLASIGNKPRQDYEGIHFDVVMDQVESLL